LITPIHRPLRVPGRRLVITKRMVETAIENTNSNSSAARWIGISYNTYKKWATYYGVFEQHKNQSGKGIRKGWATYKVPLEQVFNGTSTIKYSDKVFKKRLVEEGYAVEDCAICGWNEPRLTDQLVCLKVDYISGDSENKHIDNVRLLCPNCYFTNNGFFHSSTTFCK